MTKYIPASIRFNNPGAQYSGPSARKFGSKAASIIGGGHQIAEFDSPVNGAAAQFDLLRRVYTGRTLRAAITKWCGGNSPDSYLKVIKRMTGLEPDDNFPASYIDNPSTAIPFAKAMAYHEAGRDYPMSDADWAKAHALAFPRSTAHVGSPYDLAHSLIGTHEVAGSADNPEIMRWYVDAGHPEIKHDETPNCAAFVCSTLERTGMANPKTLAARDFLKYGEQIEEPEAGCIAVLWRNSVASWEGHVGYVVRYTSKTIDLLGANQDAEVNIKTFQRTKVLGFRRPVPAFKTATRTINDSVTLRTTLNGIGAIIVGAIATFWSWLQSLADWTGTAIGLIPVATTHAETTIEVAKRTSAVFQLAWPLAMGTALAVVCFAYVFWRGLSERRVVK